MSQNHLKKGTLYLEGSFKVVARYIAFQEKWGGEKGSDFGVQCLTWHRFIVCCGHTASSRGSTATFFITILYMQNSCFFSFLRPLCKWCGVINKSYVNFVVSLLNSMHLIVQLPVSNSMEARRCVRYPFEWPISEVFLFELKLITSNPHVEFSG